MSKGAIPSYANLTMDVFYFFITTVTVIITTINTCLGEACGHQCVNNNTCNFKNINNVCYYVFKDKGRTWFESKHFCEDRRLSMVKITKKMIENGFDFKDLFQDLPRDLFQTEHPVWLGGRALDLDEWTFLNDTFITSLDILKPSDYYINISYAQCGTIKHQGNKLELGLQPCYYESYFLCRFENCATNNNCWRLLPEQGTWFEARSYCLDSGGDLFYLKDGEKLDSFPSLTIMLYNTTDMKIFIGLRHRIWQWFDGTEILYTKWADRAPNTHAKTCLVLHWASGIWNDNLCNDIKLAFCQHEIRPDESMTEATSGSSSPDETTDSTVNPTTTQSSTITNPHLTTPTKRLSSTIASSPSGIIEGKNMDSFLPIILGSLLGIFFVITVALVVFITYRKCRNKSSEQDVEFLENNYYEISSVPVNDAPVIAPTPLPAKPLESVVEYSSHINGGTEKNGVAVQSTKPKLKPKPIIGPKTGDIYSSVDKLNRTISPPVNSTQYVNSN